MEVHEPIAAPRLHPALEAAEARMRADTERLHRRAEKARAEQAALAKVR